MYASNKCYIYIERLNNSQLFFYKFQCKVKYEIQTEKTIYLRNKKYDKYLELWREIEDNLT